MDWNRRGNSRISARMDPLVKWIGGSTFAVLALLLGGAMLARSPAPSQSSDMPQVMEGWLVADDAPAQSNARAPIAAGTDAAGSEPDAKPAPPTYPANEPDDPFVIKRVLPIDGPIRYGEWHWDDAGVPEGPLVMTVDLQARVISVFRNGYEVGAAAALLGTPEHPTPVGRFPILSKERHNVSEKYGNAPMPWTLRLTHDGVAVHGGSNVERGYASHGCIGVPDAFASRLFAIAQKGDVVIITDGVITGIGGVLAAR